jgi:hypothetical protein
MNTLMEVVKYVCDQNDIHVKQLSDRIGFKFMLSGKNIMFVGGIEIDEKYGAVSVTTHVPLMVPKNIMAKIVELVVRINEATCVGNLELHIETGTICYKTSIIFGKAPAHHEIIEHLLFANWILADRWFPLIAEVLFGNTSPQKAFEAFLDSEDTLCESEDTSPSVHPLRHNLGDLAGGSLN